MYGFRPIPFYWEMVLDVFLIRFNWIDFQVPMRWFFQIFVFVLVFVPITVKAMELEALEARIALEDVAKVIGTFFPKINGKILSREGDQLILDIEDVAQAAPGILFSVIRTGSPFYNPLSGKIMGYSEEELGTIQLIDSRADSPIAKVLEEKRSIGVGDIVRLSGGRIPLVVEFDDDLRVGGLGKELRAALEETSRFTVVEHFDPLSAPYVLKISTRVIDPEEVEMGIQLHVMSLNYKISQFNISVSLSKTE